jgi:hypothetical protein
MKKQKTIKRGLPYLDYMSRVGEKVQWTDLTGKKYTGRVVSINEDYIATLKLDDGSMIEYKC